VTYVNVVDPLRPSRPPPRPVSGLPFKAAPLPLNVVLAIVAVAALSRPPPSPLGTVLMLNVSAVRLSVPVRFAIPPPRLVAMLLSIVTPWSVAMPPFQRPPPVGAKFVVRLAPNVDAFQTSVAPAAL
jgi:hypothetical protein